MSLRYEPSSEPEEAAAQVAEAHLLAAQVQRERVLY